MADRSFVDQQLQALRLDYLRQLGEKLTALSDGRLALTWLPWEPQRAVDLHRKAHSLAGSGASFGFRELSLNAHQLELALLPLCEQTVMPDAAQLALIDTALEALFGTSRALCVGAGEPCCSPVPFPLRSEGCTKNLVLLNEESSVTSNLDTQLSFFGYSVHTASDPDSLVALVRNVAPVALLLGLARLETVSASLMPLLQEPDRVPIPLIFLSQHTDLEARLKAVRAGGSAFIPSPVEISELVLLLDSLTNVAPPEPYRVLIMDDAILLTRMHTLILRGAGMHVREVYDPAELLPALAEQQPDLVLMDMYLPGCAGHELAALIRQQPAFHGMPIVFLSSETDREIQLAAMEQGGDDFLTKPVSAAHLIAAVKSRVERARVIRGQLNRDSLTGLLSHAATTEQLGRELDRAERYGGTLSVVMIDVDHFKGVNDTYGHVAGDRVLKSLARLLRQQLRSSDVVGRYGGEEFVVLLPQTSGDQALRALDRIRNQFAHIVHYAGEAAFSVTFSAGVSSVPPFGNCNSVLEAADSALYRAKQGGRNCVLLTH